jgi:hypothetical protein
LPNGEVLDAQQSLRIAKASIIEKFEKTYVQDLLGAHDGNITRAAQAAQKKPSSILATDSSTPNRCATV